MAKKPNNTAEKLGHGVCIGFIILIVLLAAVTVTFLASKFIMLVVAVQLLPLVIVFFLLAIVLGTACTISWLGSLYCDARVED